ncbi:MAG: ATP-binding protein [bacterium]|nr:ATP-binding protein [bacterium]
MTGAVELSWPEANERYLLAAVDVVRAALEHRAARLADRELEDRGAEARVALERAAESLPAPAALERLCSVFDLSTFERDVLLLAAGMETDASFGALCAAAQGDAQRDYPTFRLALDALPGAHGSALSPAGSLRCWRLLEVGAGKALSLSPLCLAERVFHYLSGVEHMDERLAGLLDPVPAGAELARSHLLLARRIASLWESVRDVSALPAVQLVGGSAADRRAIAAHACALARRRLLALPARLLPTGPKDLVTLRRLWELESALGGSALLVEAEEARDGEGARAREEAVAWLAGRVLGVVLVSRQELRRMRVRSQVTFEVDIPPTAEQRDLWHAVLGSAGVDLDGRVEQLAGQFHLGAPAIRAATVDALARLEAPGGGGEPAEEDHGGGDALVTALWDACRIQARPRLGDLAQRIEPAATWDELVLPELQLQLLRQVAVHVRRRAHVYERWGFAEKGQRGLGISALFAGASGTGKTMAAEVLAGELRLDLYRIDLSAVVSKYIGETEKNLRRVFDAAEAGGAILLFDEADALFGKRTQIKDSHDRHANIEVSYLLQRMEAYRGLAILTTNMRSALDAAFLRRLRFIVDFPFPDAAQRAEIWLRIFPEDTPTEDLDPARLSQLNVAGGNIRNIALNAAFLAADAGEPVQMGHLLQAARGEYAKLKKMLNPMAVRGWESDAGR